LQMNHDHNPELGNPRASLDACYYDTVVNDVKTLEFVCNVFGAEKVMMGSDYPFAFGDLEPRKIIEAAQLTDSDKQSILGDVAERIFHLENCGCAHS
jgi:aminocarboxymuconate-semialdehyde decarboxylase